MDLGCKLIVGSELQEEPPSLPPFSYRGVCTEIFLRFYFCLRGMGREEGGSRGLGAWSVHTAPLLMLPQCFLSLSLELVLQCQLGTLAHLMPGASRRRQAAPPVPAAAGAPARCPPLLARRPSAYLTTDSCCPALRGLSARGAGSRRDCVLPSAPAPETPSPTRPPADPRCHLHGRLRRPSRDLTGRAASSAVVLSCLVSPPPATPVFLLVFFPLPSLFPLLLPPPLVQHR